MADVRDIYRCRECGEPITPEQEADAVIDRGAQGEELRYHGRCYEQKYGTDSYAF